MINIVIIGPISIITLLIFFNSGLRYWRRRGKKLPPGPRNLPVIGNLHQLGELPHRSLRHLAEKYGPIMQLQLGQIPTIIVSSPEIAFEIMKTYDAEFCSRPATPVFMEYSYNGSDIAFSKYGESWRQLRKLGTLEFFSMKRVQSFRSVREDEVHVLIQTIKKHCSCSHDQLAADPVNLSEMFLCMTNNITCREVFGKRFSDDGECNRSPHHDLLMEMVELLGGATLLDLFPSWKWLSVITGLQGRLERNFKRVDELFEREIEEHSLSLSHDHEEEDVLHVLLKQVKDSESNLGFSLTRDHIKGILLDMFLGGTDPSAATLEWAMIELMRHPPIMKKAQDEVRGVVGNYKGKVDESDLQQLPYLKLIINETLRLHCIVPLLIHRENTQDCHLFGYDIPKNTRVFVNAWAMARDPKLWENPEEFMPERFEGSAINYKGKHFEFIPFGAGRRICAGMYLGIVAIEITLANVLYHFNWELPPGICHKDIDTSETSGLVLHSKSPVLLVARPSNVLV